MRLNNGILAGVGVLAIAASALAWWAQEERQIPRAQARLLSSIEDRDFAALEKMIAADFRDAWRHDKRWVMENCREIFGQFAMLTLERDGGRPVPGTGVRSYSEKLRIRGFGGPFAMAVRGTVNGLREPFVTEWRQRSWKPWDWELTSVSHPTLELPE